MGYRARSGGGGPSLDGPMPGRWRWADLAKNIIAMKALARSHEGERRRKGAVVQLLALPSLSSPIRALGA